MSAAGRQRARGVESPEPHGPEDDSAETDRAARAPRGFGRWRNWRLPVKFAAVVLVPVVFAVSLGLFQIYDQIQRAQRFDEITKLVEARNKIQPLLTGLQAERTQAAMLLGGATPSVQPYRTVAKKVTAGVKKAPEVLAAVEEFSPITSVGFDDFRQQLARLPKLRKQVLTSATTPVAAVNAYSDIIDSLLSLERKVINTLGDARLYGSINALLELSRAENEVRIQRALVLAGLSKNDFTPPLMDSLNDSRARLQAQLTGFRAAATPAQEREFDQVASGEAMQQRTRALDVLAQTVATQEPDNASLTLQQWNKLSKGVIGGTTKVRYSLSGDLEDRAYSLADDSKRQAILVTVLLVVALILATVVIIVVSRNLLGSLRLLRRSALDAAEHRLPDAVEARIRHGESGAELAPVPVATTEEVGQVARAFDEVNRQALYLASEQASLRRGYSDSFINISRRSQSLLERQLRLFEQLEQDEDDPDQLATLFRLDHLATRMRRNNENLMVLSGSDMARRFNQPIDLADVLRAAVSEIEHYPRVIVQSPPDTRLVGYAASDLVRLMAELLDNAANFSAPNTSVTVSSYQADDSSVTVDVLDSGIGMDDEELAEANHRLASFDEYDLSTSRRMGLLVIARLAGRHGITVRLYGGRDYDGVRASVAIPGDLVAAQPGSPPPGAQQPWASQSGAPQPGMPQPGTDSTQQLPPAMGSSQSGGFPPGPVQPGGSPSPIEQQMSPGQDSGYGRNGSHQEIPSAQQADSRNNGSRHQVLEGGLPQYSAVSEVGAHAPSPHVADPGEPIQRDQVWPSESPAESEDDHTEVELESPERLRGLFEAATRTGASEEPDARADVRSVPTGSPSTGSQPADAPGSTPTPRPRGEGGPQASAAEQAPQGASPIFAEMATQWFQPAPDNESSEHTTEPDQQAQQAWPDVAEDAGAPAARPAEASGSWAFDSDVAAQQVGPAPRAEPTGYTASGLPRREPRAAGGNGDGTPESSSVAPAERDEEIRPVESASGRASAPGEWPEMPRTSVGPVAPAQGNPNPASEIDPAGGQRGGARQRDPEELRGRLSSYQQGARQSPAAAAGGGSSPDVNPDAGAWNFSTDQAQQEAEAAANPTPSEFTAAGLPRRTPRAHLAPGSAGPPQGQSSSGAPQKPEPDEMRGRLSSFQQGIRRGRHSAGD